MVTVKDVSDFINKTAPYETKCDWDNCGLLVGSYAQECRKIGFVLDLTYETLSEAEKCGCDLIVTHHPVIFRPKKSFLSGDVVFEAASKGISVISAHTCFDCADGGVNDVLADILGLTEVKGVPSSECSVPMARIGVINKTSSENFASYVAKKLATTVRFVDAENEIERVAVCGGSGMSFLDDVISMGADAYVTGDISHHEMLEAKEKGITVIAAGHFETEYPSMYALKNYVSEGFSEVETVVLLQNNPVKFIS